MKEKLRRRTVWFMPIDQKGGKVVSPGIAKEGETGYYKTDITWEIGQAFTWEKAEETCRKINQMGEYEDWEVEYVIGTTFHSTDMDDFQLKRHREEFEKDYKEKPDDKKETDKA